MKHFVDLASLKRSALSSLLVCVGWIAFAQNIPVGTWRTHFSYLDARNLAVTPDKVFCATEIGLFSREHANGSLRRLSKIDGLSDVEISTLAYNENLNLLVVGYTSGFVDFVFEDELLTISAIANSNLAGSRTINDIAFGSSLTFLATDLGVVVVNSTETKILENYVQIGAEGRAVEVNEILVRNDSLFVRTEEGIQSGSLSSNLLDFSSWIRYPSSSGFEEIEIIGSEIYAISTPDLWRYSNGAWIDTGFDLPDGSTDLYEVNGQLLTSANGIIYRLGAGGFEVWLSTSVTSINDVASFGTEIFIADGLQGLINEEGDQLSPSGPVSNTFSNFRVLASELYGFHAPSPFTYDGSVQVEEFSKFSDGEWETASIPHFTNVSDVTIFNGNLYYSSIGDGLFDEMNDAIITDIPGSASELDTIVNALAGGESLWISSFRNQSPIHTMDADGNWTSYASLAVGDEEFLTIDVSEIGIGWLGAASGIITVLDPEAIQIDQISTSDGLPSSFIDIDISIEDNAWVATSRGPVLFPDASFIFSDSQGILPTFENRILFEDEQINAVLTDGGNRVWFGTNQGVWVYDENTSEQVAVFNETNSPLPSNQIIQMNYNGSNGEVFILTNKGMVSYRSASSIASRDHRNVKIFPNPVRPDYQGVVGLSGLARNAIVKVTDINGNLVREIVANGGSASWDLTNVKGGKISTGVYFLFSSSSDGEETYVGKIAVVR